MNTINSKYTEQQLQVHNIPLYNKLFKESKFNSFNLSCTSNYINDGINENGVYNLGELNNAGCNLFDFCQKAVAEIRKNQEKYTNLNESSLDHSILVWKKFIDAGRSYATYEYAKLIIDAIKGTGYPFIENLNQSEGIFIIKKFQSIPDSAKFFVRFTYYGKEKNERQALLTNLFKFFYENQNIFKTIERIEIALEDIPKIRLSKDAPAFSIFFNYEYVKNVQQKEIINLISFFEENDTGSIQEGIKGKYCMNISNNTYLSQGFNNYKKYLALMDALNLEYDRDTNYAFARNKHSIYQERKTKLRLLGKEV